MFEACNVTSNLKWSKLVLWIMQCYGLLVYVNCKLMDCEMCVQ